MRAAPAVIPNEPRPGLPIRTRRIGVGVYQPQWEIKRIFATIRDKSDVLQREPLRQTFDDLLLKGIDSIGRAHVILFPDIFSKERA
jgi:hypothetical protein